MLLTAKKVAKVLGSLEDVAELSKFLNGNDVDLVRALVESVRCGAARIILHVDSGRNCRITTLAAEYWHAAEDFHVSEYAKLVASWVHSCQITYRQAELSLFAYELVGLCNLAMHIRCGRRGSAERAAGQLRRSAAVRTEQLIELAIPVGSILLNDPLVPFDQLSSETQNAYRDAICGRAAASGRTFGEIAEESIAKARVALSKGEGPQAHCGHYLFGGFTSNGGLAPKPLRISRRLWLCVLTTGLLSALAVVLSPIGLLGSLSSQWLPVILVATLAFGAMTPVAESLLGCAAGPRFLPRMNFVAEGLPDSHRVVVAVPVVLASRSQISEVLANVCWNLRVAADTNVVLALLTDFPDSVELAQSEEEDDLLGCLMEEVKELQLSGVALVLLHRGRSVLRDGKWIGWERKRGKLLQLNQLIETGDLSFSTTLGDVRSLIGVRYVLCLDEDSRISRDCIQLMAGALAHPLNWPVIDKESGVVKSGYGLIVPRFITRNAALAQWRLSGSFSGPIGSECNVVVRTRNFLFDWIGVTQYPGKGMYDVHAFQSAVGRSLPEGQILSHDTIEGALLRCAYDGTVLISEGFPSSPLTLLLRTHRWVRGDMQNYLLLWLFAPKRMRLLTHGTLFGYMVNTQFRLSLAPCLISAVLGAWCISGALVSQRALWALLLFMAFIPVVQVAQQTWSDLQRKEASPSILGRRLSGALVSVALRGAGAWTSAWVTLDAVIRTCVRVVTRRNLLEWKSAALAQQAAIRSVSVPGVALGSITAMALATICFARDQRPMAALLATVWALYPFLVSAVALRGRG